MNEAFCSVRENYYLKSAPIPCTFQKNENRSLNAEINICWRSL